MRQQPLTHWSMPTHAASLSPFLVPLSHPYATPLLPLFLPYPSALSRSLPRSFRLPLTRPLCLCSSLCLSLFVPHSASRNLFLSRARCSLSLYLPPDPTSPSRDVLALSLRHSRSLVCSLSPRPFCSMASVYWTPVGSQDFDRFIEPDLIGFLRPATRARTRAPARESEHFFLSFACVTRDPPPCNTSMLSDRPTEQKFARN